METPSIRNYHLFKPFLRNKECLRKISSVFTARFFKKYFINYVDFERNNPVMETHHPFIETHDTLMETQNYLWKPLFRDSEFPRKVSWCTEL